MKVATANRNTCGWGPLLLDSNDANEFSTSSIHAETIFPPVFGRRLQAQVSRKGERLIMEVEVTGLPDPTVTWLKDDIPLQDAGISEHRLLAQGNSYKLIIEKGECLNFP